METMGIKRINPLRSRSAIGRGSKELWCLLILLSAQAVKEQAIIYLDQLPLSELSCNLSGTKQKI
jgi:hypothetical protein